MNLYDEKLNELINDFKDRVAALTLHNAKIDTFGKVIDEIKLSNIPTIHFISVSSIDQSLSFFLQIQKADESEIQKTIEISCKLLSVDIEDVKTVFKFGYPSYGYLINLKDKCKFYISLQDVEAHYCPEAIAGILEEFKKEKLQQTYLSFDLADPNGDRTEVAA